ncbi:venom carboxylesterase-6 [Folsomia candida]|uniref:venom carboxylesterase-6 n=1 Tax=Folsomia candida TaxID=158441 RepID=UPI000B8F5CCB|nr:venom carboxylesterase-6 [Folsomia candida]
MSAATPQSKETFGSSYCEKQKYIWTYLANLFEGRKKVSIRIEDYSQKSDKSSHVKSSKSTKQSLLLISAYIYVPILLAAAVVRYYGGVNEAMIAAMTLMYYNYGLLHGHGPPVFVDIEDGRLKGFTAYSREGREYYEFLGIRYSEAMIGKLRFQAPIPAPKWEGVKDATGYGPACTQYDLFLQAVMGEEDCLTLNIYSPQINSTDGKLLPVLIFIHGGMFHFGRAMDFRGTHFMDEAVVIVTINYRLQAFGFLNTGDGVVRGNMGLKDQVMAMRWVKRNIASFGGDPGLVTIWGESAGGASTHLHTLSPMSKGLFTRAISNSGFALAHWSFIRKPKEQSEIFAKKLGCPTQSTHEMVECLQKVSSYRIAELFRGNHDVLHPRLDVFAPTIESGSPNDNDTETFLSEHPRELLRRGEIISKVPMINGANSHEGLIYAGYFVRNQTITDSLNDEWHKHSPVLMDFEDLHNETRHEVASQIWDYYLGNKTVGMASLYEIVDLFSDTSFFKPMEETALEFAKSLPLYLYLYNHHGEFGVAQGYFRITMKLPMALDGLMATGLQMLKKHVFGIQEKHWGVSHADELALFFKMHPVLSRIDPGHEEYQFSRELIRSWAYFAKHGKPPAFNGEHQWTPVISGQPLKYMKLDSAKSPGLIQAPWSERLKFLSSLPGFQCITQYHNTTNPSICI